MKLEFLDDIGDRGRYPQVISERVLRLSHFDTREAAEFKRLIQEMISQEIKEINLKSLEFVTPVNCNLILRISEMDEGLATMDNSNFTCNLTRTSYENMVALIVPFCNNTSGHQWLYNLDCPIDFLFSPGGTW
jgi:hypothetical protein